LNDTLVNVIVSFNDTESIALGSSIGKLIAGDPTGAATANLAAAPAAFHRLADQSR
jgi:hypothetical protein